MGTRGQVAVEAALTMPVMLFVSLVALQLSLVVHARLFTDYAAFQAARTGAVWGNNGERMHDAALLAVLPTLTSVGAGPAFESALRRARSVDAQMSRYLTRVAPVPAPDVFSNIDLLGLVRVDLLSPRDDPALAGSWKVLGGADWEELDFDGVETAPEDPRLDTHWLRQTNLAATDPDEETLRQATIATVRVRYLYELRLPFANWLLFSAWFAHRSGAQLAGPLDRPRQLTPGRSVGTAPADDGFALTTAPELDALWALACGTGSLGPDGGARRFFVPLTAEASVRMQSNVQRKWLMH